ncbi:hypothetical protein [Promicromonospora soli]
MNHDSTIESVRDQLRDFAVVRDWGQFHRPRNRAMALAGEVGELLAGCGGSRTTRFTRGWLTLTLTLTLTRGTRSRRSSLTSSSTWSSSPMSAAWI